MKFTHHQLTEICVNALVALRVPELDAAIVAKHLVEAELCGYASHGIIRLPIFIDGLIDGSITSIASLKTLRESSAALQIDCQNSLGPVAVEKIVALSEERAEKQGICCVSTTNLSYISRLGGYIESSGKKGFVILLFVNDAGGYPTVFPQGGVAPFFSTNPLAVSVPRADGRPPILIDFSTGVFSRGRLRIMANKGEMLPEGVLIGASGESILDPNRLFSDTAISMAPFGGPISSYKGFGLNLLVDILAGALGGAGCSTGRFTHSNRNGLTCITLSPHFFTSLPEFIDRVESLLQAVKASTRAKGVSEIFIPGERLAMRREHALVKGIEVNDVTWDGIRRKLHDVKV